MYDPFVGIRVHMKALKEFAEENREDYGIVANSSGFRLFSKGSKVWIIGGWTGGCYERVEILGQALYKRWIVKWVPIKRLYNVRPAWVPDHIKEILKNKGTLNCVAGTKKEMIKWCERLAIWDEMRITPKDEAGFKDIRFRKLEPREEKPQKELIGNAKTFREFFLGKHPECDVKILGIAGEKQWDAMYRLTQTMADYMDYIAERNAG